MSTKTIRRVLTALLLSQLPLLCGCSVLGFSSYPVAHVLTDDTKAVLEQTPGKANVARELAKEVQIAHFLQPGDELLIETVSGDADVRVPADQQVLADGTIDIGQYGRVVVAGMTLEQAEGSVQRAIIDQTGKAVQINVRMIAPIHRYYVIGEVNSPGAYPLTGHETVLDALMEAGGLSPRASACNILLARPTEPNSCRVTLPVCYRAITQLGDTTTNYHLSPGDRIFVSRQSLCEELTGYVLGGRTCQRCCSCQAACRDPRMVGTSHPNFVDGGVQSIRPITPSSGSDGSGDHDSAAQEAAAQDFPAQLNQGFLDPLPEPQRGATNAFDGELDFDLPAELSKAAQSGKGAQ